MRTGDYLNHISGVMVRMLTLRAEIMVNPKTIKFVLSLIK
jgi:hypothetical protein